VSGVERKRVLSASRGRKSRPAWGTRAEGSDVTGGRREKTITLRVKQEGGTFGVSQGAVSIVSERKKRTFCDGLK